jgi:hypothetical protein
MVPIVANGARSCSGRIQIARRTVSLSAGFVKKRAAVGDRKACQRREAEHEYCAADGVIGKTHSLHPRLQLCEETRLSRRPRGPCRRRDTYLRAEYAYAVAAGDAGKQTNAGEVLEKHGNRTPWDAEE